MRRTALLLVIVFLVVLSASACGRGLALDSQTTESTDRGSMAVSAVYLTPATGGELTAADLDAHPSVVVVHDQAQLESAVQGVTAIWIDRGAVLSVDFAWLKARVDDRYPIALIGYSSALYSFREALNLGTIHGPYVDWAKEKITPGFSVWMTQHLDKNGVEAYMNGFAETPTADRVLAVTDSLLAETPSPITASSTTRTAVSSSVPATIVHQDDLNASNLGDRIGTNIPATIVFEGRTYAAVDKTPTKVKVIPDDLSFVGAISEGTNPIEVLPSNGRVFAIRGTDKSQAVAVRFESANGLYFYYLEYQVLE